MTLLRPAAAALTMLIASGSCFQAFASELRLIAATPMAGVVKDIGAEFERGSGHKVVAKFVSGPLVKREIDAGGAYDVVISITPVVDELIKEGKLAGDTRADLAYAVVGVGIRPGAAKPDIGTVEAFKQALLNAKSVAHSATGASGEHVKTVLQRLGIAEQMQPKLRPLSGEALAKAVLTGEAEMVIITASVIHDAGAELVGSLPAELQFYNTFAGGVGAQAGDKEAGKALIKLLTSAAAGAVLAKHGMHPGLPPK